MPEKLMPNPETEQDINSNPEQSSNGTVEEPRFKFIDRKTIIKRLKKIKQSNEEDQIKRRTGNSLDNYRECTI